MYERERALRFSTTMLPLMINLGLMDFLIPLKYDIVLENLPLLGLFVSVSFLMSSLAILSAGDITDRIGSKKTILLGILFCFIGSLIFALSGDVYVMSAGVFIWGLGYAVQSVPADAYLWTNFPRKYRGSAVGWYSAFFCSAYWIAPIISFLVIVSYGMDAAIIAGSFICLISALLLLWMRMQHGRQSLVAAISGMIREDGVVVKEIKDIVHLNGKQLSLFLNMFVFGFWWVTFSIGAPLLFFHLEHNLFGAMLMTVSFILPFTFMDYIFGRVCNSRKTRIRLLFFGMSLSAVFLFAFFFANNLILLLLLTAGSAIAIDAAWVANEVHLIEHLPPKKKGEFAGVFLFAKDLGFGFAPFFYGVFASIDLKLPFFVLGFIVLGSWILFSLTHKFGRA
jgi:MFS family permease